MNIKIFCHCSSFPSCLVKDLSALRYSPIKEAIIALLTFSGINLHKTHKIDSQSDVRELTTTI